MKKLIVCVLLGVLAGPAWCGWEYRQDEDKMTGKMTYLAAISSSNKLSLKSPYSGITGSDIFVRFSPRNGLNVLLTIDRGQFVCRVDGCSILVRFDDSPPVKFGATPPADHSSTTLFIDSEQRFVALAKKAKRIRVAATIYENGEPIIEFDSPDPLKWEPGKK